jgi:hypothetical protein
VKWPAELKDDLEARFCQTVCAASDWTESYRRKFRLKAAN